MLSLLTGRGEPVEAQVRHDSRQPGNRFFDVCAIRAGPTQECVLEHVFSIGCRPKEAVGQPKQPVPFVFEELCYYLDGGQNLKPARIAEASASTRIGPVTFGDSVRSNRACRSWRSWDHDQGR